MSNDVQKTGHTADDYAQWLITLLALGLMVAAFVAALDWPRRAAFFPLLLSGFGSALLILKLLQMILVAMLVRAGTIAPPPGVDDAPKGDDEPDETGQTSIFATSSSKAWLEVLLCLAAFFLLLSLAGVIAAIFVFGIGYLTLIARKSVLFSLIYTALLVGVVHVMFVVMLGLPLPEGILFQ